jgi:hypothetical protein
MSWLLLLTTPPRNHWRATRRVKARLSHRRPLVRREAALTAVLPSPRPARGGLLLRLFLAARHGLHQPTLPRGPSLLARTPGAGALRGGAPRGSAGGVAALPPAQRERPASAASVGGGAAERSEVTCADDRRRHGGGSGGPRAPAGGPRAASEAKRAARRPRSHARRVPRLRAKRA